MWYTTAAGVAQKPTVALAQFPSVATICWYVLPTTAG